VGFGPNVIAVRLIVNERPGSVVTEGLLLITLILYPVPPGVFAGIVALIVPAVVAFLVPMLIGDAKDPELLESCAVKVFGLINVPVIVNVTATGAVVVAPMQTVLGFKSVVVIVGCPNAAKAINTKHTDAKKNLLMVIPLSRLRTANESLPLIFPDSSIKIRFQFSVKKPAQVIY